MCFFPSFCPLIPNLDLWWACQRQRSCCRYQLLQLKNQSVTTLGAMYCNFWLNPLPALLALLSSTPAVKLLRSQTVEYCPISPARLHIYPSGWDSEGLSVDQERGFWRLGASTRNRPMPHRQLDICVSLFDVKLAHYWGVVLFCFFLIFSSLLICGSDALDNPVEFSLLDRWLLPDTDC